MSIKLETEYFSVVYRGVAPGDEARAVGGHPKAVAMSWSHALRERDAYEQALKNLDRHPIPESGDKADPDEDRPLAYHLAEILREDHEQGQMHIPTARKAADELVRLQDEVMEQCRLNAMGSERESRLMAQVEEMRRELAALRQSSTDQGANDFADRDRAG